MAGTIPVLARLLARLRRDRRGAVTVLAAVGTVMAMAAGALAVDLGSVFYESRRLQGIADAAALAAAGNPTAATASAQAAITAANWSRTISSVVTPGNWRPDKLRAPAQRFVATGANVNAAKVRLTIDTPLYLGRVFGLRALRIAREATATRIDLASFSIGSRLAAVDQGIANALLGGLTGSSVSLSASDYDALAHADVDLLSYVPALRTEQRLGAVSFDDVLATPITSAGALRALAATLTAAGNAAAAAAVAKIAAAAPGSAITPAALLALGLVGGQDRVAGGNAVNIGAYGLALGMLQLSGGGRQVKLDLGALAPGLSSLSATIAVGDRMQSSPWTALTDSGDPTVSTAQTRIYMQAGIEAPAALKALGVATVRLPLYIELAPARARLASLACSQTERSASLDVQPAIGHASIAEVDPAALASSAPPVESPARIVTLPLVGVTGSSRTDFSDGAWRPVPFSAVEIDAGTTKTVGSSGIASTMATSLAGQTTLTATAAGVPIASPTLIALVRPVIQAIGPLLDPAVDSLLDLLGVHLGQADVRVDGLRCAAAALVA